jgi:hypothetical protein
MSPIEEPGAESGVGIPFKVTSFQINFVLYVEIYPVVEYGTL